MSPTQMQSRKGMRQMGGMGIVANQPAGYSDFFPERSWKSGFYKQCPNLKTKQNMMCVRKSFPVGHSCPSSFCGLLCLAVTFISKYFALYDLGRLVHGMSQKVLRLGKSRFRPPERCRLLEWRPEAAELIPELSRGAQPGLRDSLAEWLVTGAFRS